MTKAQTTATKAAAKPIASRPAAEMKKDAKTTGKVSAAAKPAAKKAAAPTPSAAITLSIALDATAAVVDKFIAGIKSRGAKLDTDIHSAACACLNHVKMHNDPTLLNRLVSALPKAARQNALIAWALKHGNVALNSGANKGEFPLVYLKEKEANIEAAVAEPFWALKNVREGGREWLYSDYITNVMKTLARVATDPNNKEAKKAKAALDAITAVNEGINTAPDDIRPAPTWAPGMQDRRAEAERPADVVTH